MSGLPWDRFETYLRNPPGGALKADRLIVRSAIGEPLIGWDGELVSATTKLPLTFFPASSSHRSVFSEKAHRSEVAVVKPSLAWWSWLVENHQAASSSSQAASSSAGWQARGGLRLDPSTLVQLLGPALCAAAFKKTSDKTSNNDDDDDDDDGGGGDVDNSASSISMSTSTSTTSSQARVEILGASVWAGAGRTRTPLHVDLVHAVVFQVAGSKRWLLASESSVEEAVDSGELSPEVLSEGNTDNFLKEGSHEEVYGVVDSSGASGASGGSGGSASSGSGSVGDSGGGGDDGGSDGNGRKSDGGGTWTTSKVLKGQVVTLMPGDALLVPAGLYHDVESQGSSSSEGKKNDGGENENSGGGDGGGGDGGGGGGGGGDGGGGDGGGGGGGGASFSVTVRFALDPGCKCKSRDCCRPVGHWGEHVVLDPPTDADADGSADGGAASSTAAGAATSAASSGAAAAADAGGGSKGAFFKLWREKTKAQEQQPVAATTATTNTNTASASAAAGEAQAAQAATQAVTAAAAQAAAGGNKSKAITSTQRMFVKWREVAAVETATPPTQPSPAVPPQGQPQAVSPPEKKSSLMASPQHITGGGGGGGDAGGGDGEGGDENPVRVTRAFAGLFLENLVTHLNSSSSSSGGVPADLALRSFVDFLSSSKKSDGANVATWSTTTTPAASPSNQHQHQHQQHQHHQHHQRQQQQRDQYQALGLDHARLADSLLAVLPFRHGRTAFDPNRVLKGEEEGEKKKAGSSSSSSSSSSSQSVIKQHVDLVFREVFARTPLRYFLKHVDDGSSLLSLKLAPLASSPHPTSSLTCDVGNGPAAAAAAVTVAVVEDVKEAEEDLEVDD